MEEVPNYTQVREGDHAMVAWRMPRYQYEFYIMTPSGDKLMALDSNKVYILPKYWLRTRMVEVVTSRNTSTYVFRLYNVTLADAGRYSCRIEKSATKIYKMTQCTHDLIVSSPDVRDSNAVMTSPVPERSPPDVTVVVGCSIVAFTLILLATIFLIRLEHIREYWSVRFRQSYLTPTQTTHGPHEQEGVDEYAVIEDTDGSGSVFYHMQSPRASSSDYEEVRPFPSLDAQTSAEPGTVDNTDAENSN
ncbi:uncharacterized protein LOC125375934 [Haliotis rufescens]|uniref:uncharacterized protein LOC125375934 n=1 Tax=Haliotis rufescens TaxID=6454 RepID=UPI00201ED1AF|nr:uncharacterized protein LOC125375934 [Haliotis rufescens]